jgi:prepilin peptidase CpaA
MASVKLLVIMSIAGGILTLLILLVHRARKQEGRPKIPYGVAIAVGAWAILAERYLNHFA